MSEHFPILIDVELNHVGRVLRLLDTTPGIVNIHLKMRPERGRVGRPPNALRALRQMQETEQQQEKPERVQSERTPISTIGHALMHGAMHYKIIQQILNRNGFSSNNVYKSLKRLVALKLVKRTAPGTYRLTEKGERKFSSNNQLKQLTHNGGVRGGLKPLLMSLTRERISHKDLMNKIMESGYAKNNIYTAVPALIESGDINRVGDDYELTNKGRDRLRSLTEVNAAHEASENTNNG